MQRLFITAAASLCIVFSSFAALPLGSRENVLPPDTAASISSSFASIENAYFELDRLVRGFNKEHAEREDLRESAQRLEQNLDRLYRPLVELRSRLSDGTATAADEADSELLTSRGLSYFPDSKIEDEEPEPAAALRLQSAQTNVFEDAGLEFSGFMDGVWEKPTTTSARGEAFLNQVELDLAHEINERTAIELAIAYGEVFEVGAATIQYTMWEREARARRSATSGAIAVGQFDVPFGLDFEEYASIDRKLVSVPLAVHGLHHCWNDVGAVSALSLGAVALDTWLVHGFETRHWIGAEPYTEDVAADDEHWLDATAEVSTGFRTTISFAESFASGFSLARGWLLKQPTMSLAGFHSQAVVEPFEFKGELLYGRRYESQSPEERWGYYTQALGGFGRYFLVGRYDYYELGNAEPAVFVSTGAGVEIASGLEYRTEYRFDMRGEDDRIYLQLVAGF